MYLVRSGHLGAFTGRGLLGCGDLRMGQLRRDHRQDKK
jgi:hypothetical protein